MRKIRMEKKGVEGSPFVEQKIVIDNVPDLGDKSGSQFLKHLEQAIAICQEMINEGYNLVAFMSYPNRGVEFVLKKSCQ